jgi:thioredoxin 1
MIDRRKFAFAVIGAALLAVPRISAAWAGAHTPFSNDAFQKAQAVGKPILIDVYASWCPVCKAQQPILGELTSEPKFKNLEVFRIDYDSQKDALRRFGVNRQSTLIVFKGTQEMGRSVGDTQPASIASLLNKAL